MYRTIEFTYMYIWRDRWEVWDGLEIDGENSNARHLYSMVSGVK